jgi:hypothetical protein
MKTAGGCTTTEPASEANSGGRRGRGDRQHESEEGKMQEKLTGEAIAHNDVERVQAQRLPELV